MSTISLVILGLAGSALASPLGISLPPLIPSIPGVTEPLASKLAIPLPILQIPTPPLESPPFQGSDLKPKKIGYFWTGAGDNIHAGKSLKSMNARWANDEYRFSGYLQSRRCT